MQKFLLIPAIFHIVAIMCFLFSIATDKENKFIGLNLTGITINLVLLLFLTQL